MTTPLITLASDFGESSAYLAMLKGALLKLCPHARLVDLSHALPSDEAWAAAFLWRRAYPYYPAASIHLLGLDRGGGPDRVLVAAAAGQYFLALDQGGLGLVLEREPQAQVWAVPLKPRPPFVARDVLAGLAGRLVQGVAASELGAAVEDWQRLSLPQPQPGAGGMRGQILHVDRFGNLITNFTRQHLAAPQAVEINGVIVQRWCSNFADAPPGEPAMLWGAEEWLEVVVARASAARQLGARPGTVAWLR